MELEILLWCLDVVSSYMSFSIYVIMSMIWMFNVEPGEGKKKPLYSSLCIQLSERSGMSHNTDEASKLKCQGQSVGGGVARVFQKQ